jgi:dUTP pyrophosphatase
MKVFKQRESAAIPEFATEGSACFDLRACLEEGMKIKTYNPHNKMIEIPVKAGPNGLHVQLQPQFRTLIPTGLIFNIPNNHVMKCYARSGMAVKYGLGLANSVGIIDSDYVEEVFVTIFNMNDTPITIYNGDRLAQAMLEKTITYTLEETTRRPSQKTEREGGFGSTGVE